LEGLCGKTNMEAIRRDIGSYFSRLARSGSFALRGLHGVRYDQPFACAFLSVSSSFLALPPPRPLADASVFRGPLRIGLAVAGIRAAMEIVRLATLPRLYIERALGLIFVLAVAWAGTVVIDLVSERWHSRLDPRVQAVSYSVLPLGRQVTKLLIFLFAIHSGDADCSGHRKGGWRGKRE
jgi:hypothetical protein